MNETTTLQSEKRAEKRDQVRRRLRGLLRRARAGMTLIEIMVVVIIMGLIASAVGIGVFNALKKAKVKQTEQAIDVIRSAVRLYDNDHPGQCPTIDQLRADGTLDSSKSANDSWGHQFRINCEGGDVAVTSDGPDGHQGTDDDIPPPSAQH
jgi:general secretion pathway protein G